MVKDAEAHEAEDKQRKEAIEARNQLDSLVFQMEKMLADNREKLDEAARAEVERGIENAKKVLEANKEAERGGAVQDRVQVAAEGLVQDGRADVQAGGTE